jgi:DNA-binding HxlR family transcriptional regulator
MNGEFSASTKQMRAGAHLLAMATNRINRGILRQLTDRNLAWGPGQEARITPTGRRVLFVSFVAERWLQSAPDGPIDFESDVAEETTDALVQGWSAALMHALAREPMTLHELDHAIDGIRRRELKRRLLAMRSTGLVEARPSEGEGALYAVTDWLRYAIAPLAAAARLERHDPKEGMAPIDSLDVEAAFLLTLPLLELPAEVSGSCRLGVEVDGGGLAGATARIEAGRVASCVVRVEDPADAWAIADPDDWLDTVIEPDAKRVATGGDRLLARLLLNGLHKTLFGVPVLRKTSS